MTLRIMKLFMMSLTMFLMTYAMYAVLYRQDTIVNIYYDSSQTQHHKSNHATDHGSLKTQDYKSNHGTYHGSLKNKMEYIVIQRSTRFHSNEEKDNFFKKYWILQHQMRTNYNKMQEPCKDNMTWLSYNPERTAYTVTSVKYSKVILDIQPAGQYSRIILYSYSLLGTAKRTGGDTWRIKVKGKTWVPVTLIDNADGSYEGIFLIIESGAYHISLYLDYTFCDGFKDPPPNWFIQGNGQGKHQPEDALPGNTALPFLEEKFTGNLSFRINDEKYSVYAEFKDSLPNVYRQNKCYMLDGYGRWLNEREWKQYIETPFKLKSDTKHKKKKETLWILGDSVGDFFYKSILHKPLCKQLFASCNRTYYWVYKLYQENLTAAKLENDNNDFSIERILNELKEVIEKPELHSNSVLLLNYGLHYAMEISFAKFQNMIDRIINLIKEERQKGFKAHVIWKTTTALYKWRWACNSQAKHKAAVRFLTTQRVELYNALSTKKMCDAGINVLDVYPMTLSYPNGTRNLCDAVHYNHIVFKSIEEYLYNYFDM